MTTEQQQRLIERLKTQGFGICHEAATLIEQLAKEVEGLKEIEQQFTAAKKEWETDEQNLVNELNAKVDLGQFADLQHQLSLVTADRDKWQRMANQTA